MCDTASIIYMPLLEETGHVPSEKYAHGPEILEQSQKIARKYSLYDNALLHTEVTSLDWEEEHNRWRVSTNRGDSFTSTFLGVGTGPFVVPKLPGIPGIDKFKGHTFHTSRWDYAYTGGSESAGGELSAAGGGSKVAEPLSKLGDKRVAIIGTGATSVQAIPHLAAAAKELYVFQRTPSSIDVRGNVPGSGFADLDRGNAPAGWQKQWQENFVKVSTK
jgi:cyclohexanone monooxygenase